MHDPFSSKLNNSKDSSIADEKVVNLSPSRRVWIHSASHIITRPRTWRNFVGLLLSRAATGQLYDELLGDEADLAFPLSFLLGLSPESNVSLRTRLKAIRQRSTLWAPPHDLGASYFCASS